MQELVARLLALLLSLELPFVMIEQLYRNGVPLRAIARRSGKSYAQVRGHLIRAGLHKPKLTRSDGKTAKCNRCRRELVVTEFRRLEHGYYICWGCDAAELRQTQVAKVNCDMETYESLFEQQSGVCAICGKPETRKTQTGGVSSLAVDHDHKTGAIRGLLCMTCNNALGHFYDSIELLENAIRYLKREQ